MKSVLKKENCIYYVSEADIIKFITQNSDIDWNDCCDFVRDNDITSDEGGKVYWTKSDVLDRPDEYNPEAIKWMTAFFEAHPGIDRVMICFD